MKLFRLRNIDEYIQHAENNREAFSFIRQVENASQVREVKEFIFQGFSYPAGKYVNFKVDYLYSDGKNINWRERLVCPLTGLTNRLRCSIHVMDLELAPYPDSVIYISEQVTPLFSFLQPKYKNLIGSEYLRKDLVSGTIVNGIRHEDMTRHSFNDGTLDYYLSFECFEHIPSYKKAVHEIFRTLKKGGIFLGTFPFDRNVYNNIIRAKIDEQGNIIHLKEPEYHGDPVNEHGILCFTVFGWELLDEFRQAGFSDVYIILVWSDVFGYLGGEQVFFIAKK